MGLRTRPNITEAEHQRMRELEAAGKSRKEIATEMRCTSGCVTRRLGRKISHQQAEEVEIVK